jgi:coatomer protein complex subunit alpha (xenin)
MRPAGSRNAQLRQLVITCREYILGLTLEMERRRLVAEEPDNVGRQLELAAYFTHCQLQPVHLVLALRSAMTTFVKAKCNATAGVFARRLRESAPGTVDARVLEQAKRIEDAGNRSGADAVEIDYDHFSTFGVCAASLSPIYPGSPSVADPFTGAVYKPEYKGQLDRISGVTEVRRRHTRRLPSFSHLCRRSDETQRVCGRWCNAGLYMTLQCTNELQRSSPQR